MLVKVSEAARELNYCAKQIYRLIREGKLDSYKFGPRSIRLDLEQIKAAAKQPNRQQ
jgi:excisionase family DNA binding protein